MPVLLCVLVTTEEAVEERFIELTSFPPIFPPFFSPRYRGHLDRGKFRLFVKSLGAIQLKERDRVNILVTKQWLTLAEPAAVPIQCLWRRVLARWEGQRRRRYLLEMSAASVIQVAFWRYLICIYARRAQFAFGTFDKRST